MYPACDTIVLKVEREKKKGDMKMKYIPIKKNAKRSISKDEAWNEEEIGTITLKPGTVVYHGSCWGELEAFNAEVTCFSFDHPTIYGSEYALVVEKPITAWRYEGNEVRIDLGLFADSVKIAYVAEAECDNEHIIIDDAGRTVALGNKFICKADEFEDTINRWNKEELEEIKARLDWPGRPRRMVTEAQYKAM